MDDHAVAIGEALRRFRQQKGISQFDLAVAMGWKGTNPVIQIEKGRRLPRPDTIERLGACLGLSYVEVHYLNGLGGYVPPTWSVLEGGTIADMETWAESQMWAVGVLVLSPGTYAVKYRVAGDGYRYLFVDAGAKRQIGYTETVSDDVVAVDGGVAFGAAIELAGERIIRYTVRPPPSSGATRR